MQYSIKDLSPVITDAILIGLVVNKGSISSFSNRVGDSKEVISFVIKDDSSSIKCTCWGNMVAQTSCFTIGDILQIEYPDIKTKKISKFLAATKSDYEIHLSDKKTSPTIQVISRNENLNYLFRPLNPVVTQFQSLESLIGQEVNLCGGIGKIFQSIPVKLKNGKESMRTKIQLFDRTSQISLIFWGEDIDSMLLRVEESKTTVFLSNVSISRFKGELQASFGFNSGIIFNPNLAYAEELQRWMENPSQNRKITEFFSKLEKSDTIKVGAKDVSKKFTILQLKDVFLTEGSECYGYFKATLCNLHLNSNSVYRGCSECKKKLVQQKRVCDCYANEPSFFFNVQADFIDHSAKIEGLTLFNDTMVLVLGMKPETFYKLSDEEKLLLESQLLWKKYAVYFKMILANHRAQYSILNCESMDNIEE